MGRKSRAKPGRPQTHTIPIPVQKRASAESSTSELWQTLRSWQNVFFALALIVAVFLAYQPAWHGAFIWDDAGHVTRPDLRSTDGLYRIWFEIGATQQYYPLLHSAFWIEHKLWGDDPLGYHLVNISLHITAALLLVMLLKRLAIPGAWLGAAIFALHPIQVESVAWITELKNTLSAVFYLGAAIAYLHFDQTRKRRWYGAALALFACGLLSKTVVATLPAALLVVFWWQRGRFDWRRDVLPLLPFFVMGAAAGRFTANFERSFIGAQGDVFDLSNVQRFLIAGRVIWFYLGKLAWPAELVFIYPRWQVDPMEWWQYLFPLTALVLLAALWALRRRTRAPLAAALLFIGTLFPVLGFFNVYPFIYSFVADHFQYLACMAVITLFAATVALGLKRADGWQHTMGQCGCAVLLTILSVLTWHQSRMYTNSETLFTATSESNPNCWMAHNNLGMLLVARGQIDEAIGHYEQALKIKPDHARAHNNLGMAYAGREQFETAIVHYSRALDFNPRYAEAHNNLGLALMSLQKIGEAIAHFENAAKLKRNYTDAHINLANALARSGRMDAAISHYQKALKINPDNTAARNNLELVLSIVHFRRILDSDPKNAEAHFNLALALRNLGRIDDAINHFRKATELLPDNLDVRIYLGMALAERRQNEEALVHLRKALVLASARNDRELTEFIQNEMSKLRR